MLPERYQYPVIITKDEQFFHIDFPGFDTNGTFAEDISNAVIAAQEVLSCLISDYENNGEMPPPPIDITQPKYKDKTIMWIDIWMPLARTETKTVYKKKTLTIPVWLDMLAQKKNLNFSHILTKALKQELGIHKQP